MASLADRVFRKFGLQQYAQLGDSAAGAPTDDGHGVEFGDGAGDPGTTFSSRAQSGLIGKALYLWVTPFLRLGGERMLVLVVTFSCSFAMALPVSTPPNAMAFATGLLPSQTLLKLGAMVSVAKDNAEVLRAIAGFDDAGDGEAVERPSAADRAVAFLEKSKNKSLVVDFGRELVDAAMTTYVRTMGDDKMYADMFEAVRNPANKAVFLEMMHAMVETSVRTYVVASMEMAMHPDEMLRGGSYAASKRDDSPTSPLASRFTPVAQTPPRSNGVHDAHIDGEIHSPALFGTWKELFQAATETRENRRLVLATTGTATMAALRGFASGTYDVIFKGKFSGHRMHVQYWVLAVCFALASVVLLLFTRLFTLFALARLPT